VIEEVKGTMPFLIFLVWLCFLLPGCEVSSEPRQKGFFTYTLDAQTREILEQLDLEDKTPGGAPFGQKFIGLFVPEKFLPYEPFVLGLATESSIPTVLYLDAPWVHRYASANWLYELDRTGVFDAKKLVPAVARAFSVKPPGATSKTPEELMGVPNSIKGNILFFRQDLLDKYKKSPPRNWDELKAICREILPREKSLKYGLIFHVTNFVNDFYPIFWGFGGKIHDDGGTLTFLEADMLAKAEPALREIVGMQGTLAPGPGALKNFEGPTTLRQAFLRGEALFMINWNTRLHDLKVMLDNPEWQGRAAIRSVSQVGVGPIPSQSGHPKKYSNIGSFGWSINRFAVTNFAVMENAKKFINLVNSDRFQVLRAENAGEIPASQSALAQVKNQDVLRIYNNIFSSPEVVLQPRPKSRKLNNILEKHLLDALYGRTTPNGAIQAAANELRQISSWD
jgi:ABC-type glycerol-3-phosphate transport system substrate-binding protein